MFCEHEAKRYPLRNLLGQRRKGAKSSQIGNIVESTLVVIISVIIISLWSSTLCSPINL